MFDSMANIFFETLPDTYAAGPGGWNDPDMLEVGVKFGEENGLN